MDVRKNLVKEREEVKAVELDVVAPMLSCVDLTCRGWSCILGTTGLRNKYRTACMNEYPDQWKRDALTLSRWIEGLSELYRHRILIRLIDPQSPLGLWKQIRHRLFRFPAFIVDKKRTYIGWDSGQLETLIEECMHQGA
jgi:hypothetical protein